MFLLTEALIGLCSFLSLLMAGVLYWNLRLHGRIEKLEVWAGKVPGVVEGHAKEVARAILDSQIDIQEQKVGRRFKEIERLLLDFASTVSQSTAQLHQLQRATEYGVRATVSETPTVESRIATEHADTDKRAVIDPSQLHPDRVRDCCRFYANHGPDRYGARRDDCPPWEQLREFCLRLRAADSVQPGGHTVPGTGLHGGPA